MGYLRIHCHQCGGAWDVYARDNWKSDTARQCPHCFASIDRQTWERQIIPAFASTIDANRALEKDCTGYNAPMFSVDFMAAQSAGRNSYDEH